MSFVYTHVQSVLVLGGAAAVLTHRWRCAAAAGWLLDLQPLRWWWRQLWQGADDRWEKERINPRCVVPHLDQRRTAAGLGAAGGLHHSDGWRVPAGALSELRCGEAGRPSGDPLVAVSVTGAGSVPPQHYTDAWWCRLVSPKSTQRFTHLHCNTDTQWVWVSIFSSALPTVDDECNYICGIHN